MGDVSLITGRPGVAKAGMPSKTWSIMACNKPIIASFDVESDLNKILRASGSGYCVPPADKEALAKAITTFKITGEINGRKYVIENASKKACVKKYVDVVESLGKGVVG